MTDQQSLPARTLPLILFFLVASFVSNGQEIPSEPAAISAGEALFNNNCRSCHRVHEKLIGPALAGVTERAPSVDWIISFVKNPPAVIASGDEYATALFDQYKPTMMTAFSTFSDEDILNILAYVQAEAAKGPATAEAPAEGQPVSSAGEGVPAAYLNLILIGMVIILVLLLIILVFLISAVKRFLDQKDLTPEQRELVHAPFTLGTILRSRGFIFIVVFVVAALGFKAVINGLYSVGIQQGYAPAQPIAFSHKIHAGQYQIDCNYCHTGVMTSKNANIPSANICMNCHNQIKQGTLTGEAEIAKIVKAYETNTPIEWVRVHNLPDLAYFNHAQHVNVGGIECQTCHGPIETMDVVRQHSLLTMGWCIDCHRQTELNTKGNAYYDRLVEIHEKESPKTKMKVVDNGGLECSKCHY
jgi:mono/diheme cytochrome c family protein